MSSDSATTLEPSLPPPSDADVANAEVAIAPAGDAASTGAVADRMVLVADDDPIARSVLSHYLARWGFKPRVAVDGTEARSILEGRDAPHLVLLDWEMPGSTGAEVCRWLRDQPDQCYRYIILLTNKNLRKERLEGLDAGADDYVTKPIDPAELQCRIRAGWRVVTLEDTLRRQVTRDALTGIRNRGAIVDCLGRELVRASREGRPLSVMLLDIDHFKQINDTHGHTAGDSVLQEVAHRLEKHVRPYDFVGRYGGEEFLIVLPGLDGEHAASCAERLRQCVADSPVTSPARAIDVKLSIGVAVARPDSAVTSMIDAADAALYDAKRAGRNRIVTADDTHWRPAKAA